MATESARVAALETALAAAEARAVESDNRRLAAEAYAKDCAALRQRIEEAAAAAAASRGAAGSGVRAGAGRQGGLGVGGFARGLLLGKVGGTGAEDGDAGPEGGVESQDLTGRGSGNVGKALSEGAKTEVEAALRQEYHASTRASNTEAAGASAIGWGSYMLGLTGGSAGGASAVDTAGEEEDAAGAQPATAQGSAAAVAAAAAAQRHATTDSKGFPKIDSDGLRGTLRSINANVASSSAGATAALSAAVGSVGHTPFPL